LFYTEKGILVSARVDADEIFSLPRRRQPTAAAAASRILMRGYRFASTETAENSKVALALFEVRCDGNYC
jgi:hypothetical protein